MGIVNFLQDLEKKRWITRRPKVIYPFLLALTYILYWYLLDIHQPTALRWLERVMFNATIFTFIFAFIHLILVKILESGNNPAPIPPTPPPTLLNLHPDPPKT